MFRDGSAGHRLRVLHVAEAFGGGLYEMVRVLADGLSREGHTVAVAYGRRPETPEHPQRDFPREVMLEPLAWGGRSPAEQVQAMRRLQAFARGWEPDVIHLHSSFAGVVGGAALAGIAPIVYTPHSFASCLPSTSPAKRQILAAGERLAISRATIVGAVSHSEARCARRRGARRVTVIPNGISELDDRALVASELARLSAATPPRSQRVIAGGRIVGQRQPDACARILGALTDDAEVAWVGGGGDDSPWTHEMRAALERHGVHATGWVPRDTWLGELSQAAAYLHWTAWDGLPLCLLEALALDTVVVASDIAPNREVLGPRQVCKTEEEAVALLRRIVADPDFAAELRAEQHERRQRYSASGMVTRWADQYAALAGLPHVARPLPVEVPAADRAERFVPAAEPVAQPA